MSWQEEIEQILTDAEEQGGWPPVVPSEPPIEEEIRTFLAGFGPQWRNCDVTVCHLQRDRVVYAALLIDKLYERYYANEDVFLIVARDAQGRLYVAPPAPVE